MDPVVLAGLAITALAPYIAEVGKEFATKAGDAAFEQAKHLYDAIHARFAKEADAGKASKVLQNFAEDPKEYAPNLENKLLLLLQADPNFANTLSQIIKTGPLQEMNFGDDASIEDTHQSTELGQGTQRMIGGQRDKFKNVSQNIGPRKEPRK